MLAQKPGRRRVPVMRALGFLIAALLGVAGVWFIVVGDSSKDVRIGVIAAFWGLLLGTFAVFGARVPADASALPAPTPPPLPPPMPPAPSPSRELDLRQIGELERSAVAAARREFQQDLQIMLRREVQDGFAREVANLRAEVTAIRNDLLEKVGGELRLERIETTRVIGSDLEAVQSELRKLRETAVDGDDAVAPALAASIPPAPPTDVLDAEIVSDEADAAHAPADGLGEAAVDSPNVWTAQLHPNGAGSKPSDLFASMPRIRPFTDFKLDSVPSTQSASEEGHSRRHRADEGGSDVLARILARERGLAR